MTTNRKVGVAIILGCALVAAVGLMVWHLAVPIGVGIAMVGIVIGTGVARGNFSSAHKGSK